MRKIILSVVVGLAVLSLVAACGGLSKEKCEKEAVKLMESFNELMMSDESAEKIEREISKLEEKADSLEERCAEFFN